MTAPPERIRIFDTSLRDGEQSPGCSMGPAQKLRFALALAELGVDTVEAGFAASSEADAEGIARIARALRGSGVGVCSLARCRPSDIEAAARALEAAEAPRLHVFIATSPLHREHKLGFSQAEVIEAAVRAVEHARRLVDDVEFSAEDAIRTEPEFLETVFAAAAAAGARTLNVPDTVGYTTPDEIEALFRRLRTALPAEAILSAHCHDDLGLAVANSLAAIAGGARQVECTINGIGERAGNAALEEIVMALSVRKDRFPFRTGIDTTRLVPTSRLLSRITGMAVQRNKAIVGANAFAHESGIHQHGMLKHRDTYEIMRPETVGWARSQMVLGRHSGRAAVNERLELLGFALEDAAKERLFARFKALAEKKKEVFDADLEALVLGEDANGAGWQLTAFHLSTGAGQGEQPAAAVELRAPDGEAHFGRGSGDGPVHALFAALTEARGLHLDIESYAVHSVSSGEDAQGQASLSTRHEGEELSASATSTDILEASALAWLALAQRVARRLARPSDPLPTATRHTVEARA
ncbi:MAG: 2-isopropylmalate synthase [Silanimonas sp.]|nr:MAG: 2-isopropylmalate synthase [Silanimonas sp.]